MESNGAAPVRDGSAVRQRIEDVAYEIFAAKGYHAAAVREIVEAAGVTAPTLYYHFGSKEGLYRHLVERLLGEMHGNVRRAGERDAPVRDQLREVARAHLSALRDTPARIRFLHRVFVGMLQPGTKDFYSPPLKLRSALEDLLTAAIARGELAPHPVGLLTNAFVGSLNMYVTRGIFGLHDELELPEGSPAAPLERLADSLVDIFLNGAAAPPRS